MSTGLLLLLLILSTQATALSLAISQTATNACVQYDEKQKLIHVYCKSIHLTDIYKQLNNSSILHVENENDMNYVASNSKIWVLNAGITIHKEGGLIIDSSDTAWLKMVATPTIQHGNQPVPIVQENDTDTYDEEDIGTIASTSNHIGGQIKNDSNTEVNNNRDRQPILVSKNNGNNPNGIHVQGSLKIDSVKITSWDPKKNDVIGFAFGKRSGEEHTKSDYDTAEPRGFIRVSKDASGTTDITNSELSYLGYSCSRCSGLSYYGGQGSVLKGNDIHHLLKGYYSKSMGNMTIEDNIVHDNYLYGIDPHTGSHDISIVRNTVYNNNASGIICSKHCYNLLIEGNRVYNNTGVGRGIAFSINTTNSIARYNDVSHQSRCISFNRNSNFNDIYNNTVSNCINGFYLSNTTNNYIHDNHLKNVTHGIVMKDINNKIKNNTVNQAKNGIVFEFETAANKTQTTDVNYVPFDGNYKQDILDIMAKDNHFSETANLTTIKIR
jgi:parallel beta-helix repeat protein